ncbi:conserved hypothetical protein [Paecilomyces variotii No. 5]|uniref:Uncharacterized protein n=1 Tax=Byssochlamys spectabilis (strain No. 5 / NBRC 109023) TaxID=1356009 RepID=V5G4Y3_BYSSN|nr:conserved hypothetical protein [Paecilomyces variotii No. 5]
MSYMFQNTVWPPQDIDPAVKHLIQRYYTLVDFNGPEAGDVLAEIRESFQETASPIMSRRHEILRIYIGDTKGHDLMIAGNNMVTLKNGNEVLGDFATRFIVDDETVFRRIFLPSCEVRSSTFTFRRNLSSSIHLRSDARQQNGRFSHEKSNGLRDHSLPRNDQPDTFPDTEDVALRPSQSLPQSPLLTKLRDPSEKKRKRAPTKEETDRLRRNPWAVALASPPRYCIATGARLPKAFLGDYGLVRPSAESESLWFMPVSLLKDELKPAAGKAQSSLQSQDAQEQTKSATTPNPDPLRIPSIRIVDRFRVLKESTRQFLVDRVSRRRKSAVSSIIPFRWRYPHGPLSSRSEKNLVWREDMPEFVLKNIRKEAVKELGRVCRHNQDVTTSDGVWMAFSLSDNSEGSLAEALKQLPDLENMEWGGVLVLKQSSDNIQRERDLDSFASPLPDYITLPHRGKKVPVFDLSVLLSEENLEELRKLHPRFQESALFFRPGGTTPVEPMLALWRLKGYVMYDNEHSD